MKIQKKRGRFLSMADSKKYYYFKLKDDFFDDERIIMLESMKNGYPYSNILIKLYLRSLNSEGKLVINDSTPYSLPALARITGHKEAIVKKAIDAFKSLRLITEIDNEVLYLPDIQNYIGKSTTEADKKREYRSKNKEKESENTGQISDKCLDNSRTNLHQRLV